MLKVRTLRFEPQSGCYGSRVYISALPGRCRFSSVNRCLSRLVVSVHRAKLESLSQPHTRPATVRIDEFDAGGFEGAADGGEVGADWGAAFEFEAVDGADADARGLGEVGHVPAEQSSGGAALGWRDHGGIVPGSRESVKITIFC